MAVNLATKYSKDIAKAFTLKSVVDGHTNGKYDFIGVKTLKVWTPTTQALNNYARTGTNRYGTPAEMQDTVQEMAVQKDRSFSITIDAGNNDEQMRAKAPGEMLRMEMDEQVIPEMDKFALGEFIDHAGKVDALANAPTTSTIAGAVSDGLVTLANKKVPADKCTIWIAWTYFGMLRLSSQFMGIDQLGGKILQTGALGTFMGAQVVPVPDDYLKKGTSQCYFLIAHKDAVLQPKKIQDYFVKENPAGINGSLLEGRFLYGAFVLAAKCDGVYAAVASGTKQADVTFTYTAASATLAFTSSGATKILYTLDGSDPRFSDTAESISSGGTITLGTGTWKAKAVALDDALWNGDVKTDSERTVS